MMRKLCRVGDKAHCPSDSHGNKCCKPHAVTGPAVSGSSNVFVDGIPALRLGDPGVHSTCCGSNTWRVSGGSTKVFINHIPAVRLGDATTHCGGAGTMVESCDKVFVS